MDFRSPELRDQVDTSNGLRLLYEHPLDFSNPVSPCTSPCTVLEVSSLSEVRPRVLRSIREDGYPTDARPRYIKVTSSPEHLAWYRIPGVSKTKRAHGTGVASVIAGKTTGVAPKATIVPWAFPLDDDVDVQRAQRNNWIALYRNIEVLGADAQVVKDFDKAYANLERLYAGSVDIVNRSYGPSILSESGRDFNDRRNRTEWDWLNRSLPKSFDRMLQTDVVEGDKVIYVTAGGNLPAGLSDPPQFPGAAASMAWWFPELRGLHFAAVGIDSNGRLHSGSVPCGTLPSNWNPATHGKHYCLGAPYVMNVAIPGTTASHGPAGGTSFSSPMVAGGMALVMERFRGTMTPREVGRRVVDTAYEPAGYDAAKIGAGVLDIAAATSPVGSVSTGLPSNPGKASDSSITVGASYGDSMSRAVRGQEIATFDTLDAPFWFPLSSFVTQPASPLGNPIPAKQSAQVDNALPAGLSWRPLVAEETFDHHSLRLVVPTSGETVLAGRSQATGIDFSPKKGGFGAGFLYEGDGIQGGRAQGAFSSDTRTTTMWVKRKDEWDMPAGMENWHGETELVMGNANPNTRRNAMFTPGAGLFSSAKASLTRINDSGGSTEISIAQPWRAESGRGKLQYPSSRKPGGARVYETRTFGLAPAGRELAFNVRHDEPMLSGDLSAQVGYSHDAGHVQGESDYRIGLAYRLSW